MKEFPCASCGELTNDSPRITSLGQGTHCSTCSANMLLQMVQIKEQIMAFMLPKVLTSLPQSTPSYFMKLSNLNVTLQAAASVVSPAGMKCRAICNQCKETYVLPHEEVDNLVNSMAGYPGLIDFCKAHRHEGVDPETGEAAYTIRQTKVEAVKEGRVYKRNNG